MKCKPDDKLIYGAVSLFKISGMYLPSEGPKDLLYVLQEFFLQRLTSAWFAAFDV